jgi:hypothetical protein
MPSYSAVPRVAQGSPVWAVRLVQDIVTWVETIRRGPQVLTIYTMQTLPDATKCRGGMIQVSNESGGEVPAFSDGTNWRRVTDRAICS